MSVGTGYTREGSIGWGGLPGPLGAGRHWLGFTVGLIVLALLAVASVVLTPTAARAAGGLEPSAGLSQESREQALDAYGKLPLSFVPNAGQTDPSVRYSAQGSGFSFFFTEDKAVLSLAKGESGHALELHFLGSSPGATLEAGDSAPGTVNYLTAGANHTNLPTYEQLTYRGLWPGIDMVFAGRDGNLKYEFHLAPGADPSDIRLGYSGADGLSLSPDGALLVDTPLGALTDSAPTSYQNIDGRSVPIQSRYALEGHSYGFALGNYDPSQPLVIDPALAYSTYLGGFGTDAGFGVAVDASGSAYVTGQTVSPDFPTTAGAFDTTFNNGDAFVTKLSPAGTSLVYSTFLGGSGGDTGTGVVVDTAGSAYVTGSTNTPDFPTTVGAFDTTFNDGFSDAFVTKLSPTGSSMVYSTFLGGSGLDQGNGVAVDALGSAYVTGPTDSSGFPTTAGALDTTFNGGSGDAFVTKLSPTGSSLVYSTFLGGSGFDFGFGVAVDASGSAYVTGSTGSTDFPTTPGAFDTIGGGDAFVTKLSPTGTSLVYSTYLGGNGGDIGRGVAIDTSGSAYVTGQTDSTNFPTTPGAFDATFNGSIGDAFVTKLSPTGSALAYSTYLGGNLLDAGNGVAVDASGNAYVTGRTFSADFPTTPGAFDTTFNGSSGDAFVAKLSPTGSLLDSTYLGGSSGTDSGNGIAVDAAGSAYVTGQAGSALFPTTPGAFDTTLGGGSDAFVTKFSPGPGAPATLTLAPEAGTNDVGTHHCVTATVKDAAGNPTPNIAVPFTVTGSVNTTGSATTDQNGEATFCYPGPELPGADAITAFADTDNNSTQDPGEPSDAATKDWTLPTTTPLCQVNIENGGTIIANNGDKASFGGNAQSNAAGNVKGQQQYQDQGPAQPQKVKSIQILALTCQNQEDGTQATIFGRATINGQGSHLFRIDVRDLGEPGRGIDTYRILLDTGYDSGSWTLRSGNIQIR